MKKITVGIVGIGGFAEITLDDIFASIDKGRDDFEIVASVDPYPHSSKHFERLQKMGVPHFETVKDMYCAHIHPNLCLISTPIQFHTDQICHCHSHLSSVLCEKPMTGDIDDMWMLEHSDLDCDGFIAIGYQWSYSRAIQALKKDIMDGVYGKPAFMKTMVLWPRDKQYFKRSTGWAGKEYASNGKKILDSVANNATAHYIHNILYVLGNAVDDSAHVCEVKADLVRTNDIETFDTCAASFTLDCGAKGLYIASHSTKNCVNPQFEYRFEKGTVTFSEEQGVIIGKTADGRTIDYGNPFDDRSKKFFDCIDYIKEGKTEVLCGVRAAKAQVEFIAKLHSDNKIYAANPSAVTEENGALYICGLDELLEKCYESEKIPSETDALSGIAEL